MKKQNAFVGFFTGLGKGFLDIFRIFIKGDWITRISYVIMGFGNLLRGQIVRGALFLAFEAAFIWYMITKGSYWLSMLPSLGKQGPTEEYNLILDVYVTQYHDNSFHILLYGVLTIFLIIAFVYTWRVNLSQAYAAQVCKQEGKKIKKFKDDCKDLVDAKFYKTLLALPLTGIIVFTVLPLIFMILVAFTNYSQEFDGYIKALFSWVGFENFKTMFSTGGVSYGSTFLSILGWTLVWAFFATFSNYFLGILVAMMINKKGIRFKKMWRTILVMTIAIPQFISLLFVSKMFSNTGLVNGILMNWGWIKTPIHFWESPTIARVLVILINIWVGVPYLMLISTGILMNIPQDLYEAAKIDGANPVQQFRHITMPYMLFVTAPYLLTSFTSNMNNFNVIYLLSAGGPDNVQASGVAGTVGHTDLLITWLFKITTGADQKYYMASVIGILVFVVVAVITLVVYNLLPSNRNEGDFS